MTDNRLDLAQRAAVPHATPGPLTAPFWQGCAEQTLLFQRCAACSAAELPARRALQAMPVVRRGLGAQRSARRRSTAGRWCTEPRRRSSKPLTPQQLSRSTRATRC